MDVRVVVVQDVILSRAIPQVFVFRIFFKKTTIPAKDAGPSGGVVSPDRDELAR